MSNRRESALAVLCVTGAGLACGATAPSADERLQSLHVSGNQIVTEDGQSIRLRGVHFEDPFVLDKDDANLDGIPDRHFAKLEADFIRAREIGVNVVRVAIYPGYYFLVGPSYLPTYLDRVVDLAEKHRVYLIVSYHAIGRPGGFYESGSDSMLPSYPARTNYSDVEMGVRFWDAVAARYGKRPHMVFEIFNEPVDLSAPFTWADWRPSGEALIAAVRRHSTNLILGSGVNWTSDLKDVPSNPFSDNNLACVGHIYPATFPDETTQQSEWERNIGFLAATYPIFITEWGFNRNGNHLTKATREGFGIPLVDYMDRKGMHWIAFVFQPDFEPAIVERDWTTLTEFGNFVKERLGR